MTDQPDKLHEKVEDLDVADEEADEVKGGASLNFSKIEYKQQTASEGEVGRWNFENAWPRK
jgi:hypothetical protein